MRRPSPRLRHLGPPGLALDSGCGKGRNAVALARLGWEVVALDVDRRALASLRGKAIHPVVADANAQPLRDESVDAVVDSFAYTFLDPERYSRELARVLRRGGSVLVEYDDDPHVRAHSELLTKAAPLLERLELVKLWLCWHAWGDVSSAAEQVPCLALLLAKPW